jgi:hypothetical protein
VTAPTERDVVKILGEKRGLDFKYHKFDMPERAREPVELGAAPAAGSAAALFSLLGDALPESAGIAVVDGAPASPSVSATNAPELPQPTPAAWPTPVSNPTSAGSAPAGPTPAPPIQVAPIAAVPPEFGATPAGLFPTRVPTRQPAVGAQHSLGEMFRILTGRAPSHDGAGPISSFPLRRR